MFAWLERAMAKEWLMLLLEEVLLVWDYKKLRVDADTFKVAKELVFLYRFKVFTGEGLMFSEPSYVLSIFEN